MTRISARDVGHKVELKISFRWGVTHVTLTPGQVFQLANQLVDSAEQAQKEASDERDS